MLNAQCYGLKTLLMKQGGTVNSRIRLTAVLVIALAGLFLLGCPLVTSTAVEDLTESWTGQTMLVIRNVNGGVYLSTVPDEVISFHITKSVSGPDEASCRARLPDIKVTLRNTSDTVLLTVDIPNVSTYNYAAEIEAHLPARLVADISSTNGDIQIAGLTAPVKAQTTNGDIKLNNIMGDATAHTTNGKVTVTQSTGSVSATTTNGALNVQAALPESGYCRLHDTNGSIQLRIPRSTSARLLASTTNGRITFTNLFITGSVTGTRIDGRLGDGAGDIDVTTTNGNIDLSGY